MRREQVVKSESATVTVPELDFEIPSQKGSVTNVEGLLSEAAAGIRASQVHSRQICHLQSEDPTLLLESNNLV